jgi:hypothetical protein
MMATTIEALESMLHEAGLAFERSPGGTLDFTRETRTYRDGKGQGRLLITVSVADAGERVRIAVPFAFVASGPHTDVTLRACMLLQYRASAARLDYDERDGEIRATIELPLADAAVTAAQVGRCLDEMVETLDHWYPTLTRAHQDGVIGLPFLPVDRVEALRLLADELRASQDAADQLAAQAIERRLP